MGINHFEYLFPFEMIPFGSQILIYGTGELGMAYYDQISISKYCTVVGFVDRNYSSINYLDVPAFNPLKVNQIEFDYIVLAFRTGDFAEDVTKQLVRLGVDIKKIVCVGIRNLCLRDKGADEQNLSYAFYNEDDVSVAVRYGSGLGDAIIIKAFFVEFVKLSNRIKVDIYCPKAKEFIDSIYSDCPNLNMSIIDGGGLYSRKREKYDIAFSAVSFLQMDHINPDLKEKDRDLNDKIQKFKFEADKEQLNYPPVRNYGIFIRRKIYQGRNCYTAQNYTNDIVVNEKVSIPILNEWQDQYNRLGLGSYITINYGVGTSSKGNRETVSKQWPMDYYVEFVKLFKKEYSNISVIQLGGIDADKVEGADGYYFGRDLELVKYILKGSILHVDGEGGVVHLASQLGTKCIVLFGPTSEKYFGYHNNINLVSTKCSGCYGLYDTAYHCARDMKEPECMYSLEPGYVFSVLKQYFVEAGINR